MYLRIPPFWVLASDSRRKGSDAHSLFGSLGSWRKDEVQQVIPAGWRQEGHPATKTLLHFLFFNMDDNKHGRGTARSTSWATPSTYEKQNDGEPGQTAGRSSRHYEGHRYDALQGSRWGDGKILLTFHTA